MRHAFQASRTKKRCCDCWGSQEARQDSLFTHPEPVPHLIALISRREPTSISLPRNTNWYHLRHPLNTLSQPLLNLPQECLQTPSSWPHLHGIPGSQWLISIPHSLIYPSSLARSTRCLYSAEPGFHVNTFPCDKLGLNGAAPGLSASSLQTGPPPHQSTILPFLLQTLPSQVWLLHMQCLWTRCSLPNKALLTQ